MTQVTIDLEDDELEAAKDIVLMLFSTALSQKAKYPETAAENYTASAKALKVAQVLARVVVAADAVTVTEKSASKEQ